MDKIDEHLESRRDNRVQRRSLAVNFTPEQYALVSEASMGRQMSTTAFIRRACLAFATYDFDLDWDETMANEQSVAGFGTNTSTASKKAGSGHGPWVIGSASEH